MEASANLSRAHMQQADPAGILPDGTGVARRAPEPSRAEATVETSQRQEQLAAPAAQTKGGFETPNGVRGGASAWQASPNAMNPLQSTQMRPNVKDTMSPSSAESSQYATRALQLPIAESRQEEDFLMSLASPHPGGGRGGNQQGQRFHSGPMMQQEGMPPMNRLVPRALYPEDEMGGGYGQASGNGREAGMRFVRSSKQTQSHSGMQMAGSPGISMGHLHQPRDTSQQVMGGHPSEEPRDANRGGVPASPRTPAANLHRSASEGFMRSPGMSSHQRTGSAGGLQEERLMGRMGNEQPLLAPRGGESPDFAMIYAFLGSMFDPVCCMINHHDVLTQMCDIDRETSILLLSNISANLDSHGQELFGRHLSSAMQVPPSRRAGQEREGRPL